MRDNKQLENWQSKQQNLQIIESVEFFQKCLQKCLQRKQIIS